MKNNFNFQDGQSQMRKGMLEFCTLLIVSRDKVYVSDILKSLKDVNLIVVEGTLYPLLNRLKTEGYLDYMWKESPSGPPRKYYMLTTLGKEKLSILRLTWKSLVESITTLI